jgi:hypothetical protein
MLRLRARIAPGSRVRSEWRHVNGCRPFARSGLNFRRKMATVAQNRACDRQRRLCRRLCPCQRAVHRQYRADQAEFVLGRNRCPHSRAVGDRQRLASAIATELESAAVPPYRAPVGECAVNGDVPMGVPMVVDPAHEPVSISANSWQRWHEIAREIGNDDCALAKELCIANTAPTRRNLYWAATAARILVQWTTGDRQRLASAIATELESAGAPPH